MLWASRNKHRGRHAAAAATEREEGRENIYKMKRSMPGKYEIPLSFFFFFSNGILRTVSCRKGCACFCIKPKVYFQEEDSCFLTNGLQFLWQPSLLPLAWQILKCLRDRLSFTSRNTKFVMPCYTLHACPRSDSCSPPKGWWEMVDYITFLYILWYRTVKLSLQILYWSIATSWKGGSFEWSYQRNEMSHIGLKGSEARHHNYLISKHQTSV